MYRIRRNLTDVDLGDAHVHRIQMIPGFGRNVSSNSSRSGSGPVKNGMEASLS
jgi:hypothetical protein